MKINIYIYVIASIILIVTSIYYIFYYTKPTQQETDEDLLTEEPVFDNIKTSPNTTQETTQETTEETVQETPCDKFARTSEEVVKKYNKAKTEWDNFYTLEYSPYLNNTGKFSKYKDYGTSKQFNIQYGGTNWDPNKACSECATGKYPFFETDPSPGNSNFSGKFGGGAFCQMNGVSSGVFENLLNGDKYEKRADGGGQGNGRYWWSCYKPDDVINSENIEKQKIIPKLPETLSTYVNTETYNNGNIKSYSFKSLILPNFEATCCSQNFEGINGSKVIIDKIKQQCGK